MARDAGLGWDIEALSKAYRQGFMAGTMGLSRRRCPYRGEVVLSAWEAGWEDGLAQAQPPANQDQFQSRSA